jgi:hypothetical protein
MIRFRLLLTSVLSLSLALLLAGCSRKASPGEIKAWNQELARLQAEQDSLRVEAAALVQKDPRILALPDGDVVIAVPTEFIQSVIERLFRDVVDHVTLRLSGIKAHVQKKVKKVVTIGEFTVDVDIIRVVGLLRPGQPRFAFGGDSISMSLPVSVAKGDGEAMIHFVWDGKNVAGIACGDMDITQKVTGAVIPSDYNVAGRMILKVQGKRVVGAFHFPETRVRLRVRASKESWDAINAVLDEKKRLCGFVLDKVNVPQLLTNLTEEKGFNVRLPIDKLKPVVLPAGVRDSVTIGQKTLLISAQTSSIRIDRDAIWYSAKVGLKPASGEP